MQSNSKILVTGGGGLVGNALVAELKRQNFTDVVAPSSRDCDLTDMQATLALFRQHKPAYVFHLAAAVFGIMGNMQQKGLSYLSNTLINTHVVEATRQVNAKKIVAMGTGCIYPYPPPNDPLREETIWQGYPHPSEDSYAIAKRAMLVQLSAYRESYNLASAFVISGNLYGPHDKFDIEHGHVTPSLIRKFYEAKKNNTRVVVWGNGSARRDFMYASDVASALIKIMHTTEGPINMGSGVINSIRDIVDILADHTQLQGKIDWDATKPNGQEYRAYDLQKLRATGFSPTVEFAQGIKQTYDWYAAHAELARK